MMLTAHQRPGADKETQQLGFRDLWFRVYRVLGFRDLGFRGFKGSGFRDSGFRGLRIQVLFRV